MKKKISLLGLVLILVLSFTGCGKSEDKAAYDEAQLEQYAGFIIQNFSAMGEQDFARFSDMSDLELNLTLVNTGVPVEGENFISMMGSWTAGELECGEFIGLKDNFIAEETNEGVRLIAEADFEDRDGTVEFTFDEKGRMDSLTIGAHYSIAEILEKAGLNTVLGMGTVFVVLIFISFIISLFRFIPVIEAKFKKGGKTDSAKEPAKAAPAPAVEETTDVTADTELVAVIAAAVAAAEGTSPDGFVVRSIKRRKSNKWN